MHDIVIAGGGYAGLWAALGAARQAAEAGAALDIALVSREPWLTARPRLYEYDLTEQDARHPLKPILDAVGATLILGEIVDVSPDPAELTLDDGQRIRGRAMVLAFGSRARRAPFAGAIHGIDTWPEAAAFWRALAAVKDRPAPVVAVVGAGFTGLELATELAFWREAEAPAARILLLDRASPAAGYQGPARAAILDALADLRIETATLADGEAPAADVVVWTGGLETASPASLLPGSRGGDGRWAADATLRLAPGVFGAGDVVAAPLGNATTVMSCQHALSTGAFAGHNAARALLDLPPIDYAPRPYVTCLDLGPAGALLTQGFDRTLAMKGQEAKALKRSINRQLIVPPLAGGRAALLDAANPERWKTR